MEILINITKDLLHQKDKLFFSKVISIFLPIVMVFLIIPVYAKFFYKTDTIEEFIGMLQIFTLIMLLLHIKFDRKLDYRTSEFLAPVISVIVLYLLLKVIKIESINIPDDLDNIVSIIKSENYSVKYLYTFMLDYNNNSVYYLFYQILIFVYITKVSFSTLWYALSDTITFYKWTKNIIENIIVITIYSVFFYSLSDSKIIEIMFPNR